MPIFFITSLERNHDAVLQEFRETAEALFGKFKGDIRLLEVVMREIGDNGYAVFESVIETALKLLQSLFGGLRHELGNLLPSFGEIDIKMLRLNVLPTEALVLNLVFPEVFALDDTRCE
jgi:hypothetical protein